MKENNCRSLYVSALKTCMSSAWGNMVGVFLLSRHRFWSVGRPYELCLSCALRRRLGWGPCQCWLFCCDPMEWARESAVIVTSGAAPWRCASVPVYLGGNKLFPGLYTVKYEGRHWNTKHLFLCAFRVYAVCVFLPVYCVKGCLTLCKAKESRRFPWRVYYLGSEI